jgi:hypothetical protein
MLQACKWRQRCRLAEGMYTILSWHFTGVLMYILKYACEAILKFTTAFGYQPEAVSL